MLIAIIAAAAVAHATAPSFTIPKLILPAEAKADPKAFCAGVLFVAQAQARGSALMPRSLFAYTDQGTLRCGTDGTATIEPPEAPAGPAKHD